MRIAIVGGGIAGVSLAWQFLQKGQRAVELFDPHGIGGGASGVSAGLLHPFPGRSARRSWRAAEGIEASLSLFDVAEQTLGEKVAEKSGIFRPAVTEEQRRDFSLCAESDPEAVWEEKPPFGEGIWIPSGIAVFMRRYLQGLWSACEKRGALLHYKAISSLEELASFDQIVLTTGAETLRFRECAELPLKVTKGQALLCRCREKLPFSLVSRGHITPTEDPEIYQIGSTYERRFSSLSPDPVVALGLLDQVAQFYPPARTWEVLAIRAGGRIARPMGYMPLVGKITPKAWVFSGLGSRGALYAAWIGKGLAEALCEGREFLDPIFAPIFYKPEFWV